MSNDLKLYFNKSDRMTVNKDKTTLYTLDIKLLENTDVIHPRLYLSTANDIRKCNYFYIKDFDRYYYVTKLECEKQRYILEGEVDVLSSHIDKIKEQSVIVKRSGADDLMNLYLNDPKFVLLNMPRIQLKSFDNGFKYQGNKVKNFILTINGSGQGSTPPNTGGDN